MKPILYLMVLVMSIGLIEMRVDSLKKVQEKRRKLEGEEDAKTECEQCTKPEQLFQLSCGDDFMEENEECGEGDAFDTSQILDSTCGE